MSKPDSNNNELSLINKGTIIEGKITSSQNLRIDGTLKGEIDSENKLIIGDEGIVDGAVKSKEARIYGSLEGSIEVKESIHLHQSANVNADLKVGDIIVEKGANLNGNISINKN